jgi:hypothetical protein
MTWLWVYIGFCAGWAASCGFQVVLNEYEHRKAMKGRAAD